MAWLHESELSYLNKFQNLSNNKDEMKKLYKEFCDFTERLKNQQGYVNLLIELSPKLLESSIRYGNNIAMWANKVETRYKDFFNLMSKVQLAHGLQSSATTLVNSMSSLTSSASSFLSPQNSTSGVSTTSTSILSDSFDSTKTCQNEEQPVLV